MRSPARAGRAEALQGCRLRAGANAAAAAARDHHVVAPGLKLFDTPQVPAQWRATAAGALEAFGILRDEQQIDWTFLSPSAHLEPGQRTGVFRLGTDPLLLDAKGESRISLEDHAVAMIDELEVPRHSRRRFTVGY